MNFFLLLPPSTTTTTSTHTRCSLLFSSVKKCMWNKPKSTQLGLWDLSPCSLTQVLKLLWMILRTVVPKFQVHYIELVILSAMFDDYSELSNKRQNIVTLHKACGLFHFTDILIYPCTKLSFILLCIYYIDMKVGLIALLFFKILYRKGFTFHSFNTKYLLLCTFPYL